MKEKIGVPAWDIPAYRQKIAIANGADKNFAFVTYGGLGDALCSEPTVRYACEVLKKPLGLKSITVVTRFPDLFSHLPVDILITKPDGKLTISDALEKYYFLYCGHPENNFQHLFFTHNSMLPVDYPALSSLRAPLPLAYRTVQTTIARREIDGTGGMVYIHAGAHWQSKRFPIPWWDEVLNELAYGGIVPVLIGGPVTSDEVNPGTVDVNTSGCLDLRGKLTIAETAGHLVNARVLLTNDSFPLHLATIGSAHIGFLATAKDPEWLMHYRKNEEDKIEFGWRMQNLALGGAYQRAYSENPTTQELSVASEEELKSWLPNPKLVAQWAMDKAWKK